MKKTDKPLDEMESTPEARLSAIKSIVERALREARDRGEIEFEDAQAGGEAAMQSRENHKDDDQSSQAHQQYRDHEQ